MEIYVEINIDSPIENLWAKTQTPELHERWDLRFTDIEYLPRAGESEPQQFVYSTRIGFGLNISGKGETVGSQEIDGSRTSALKFWSDDPKSLIRAGSGYWQYVPTQDGIKFLTWYDYSTRFGVLGRAFDAVVFRPLMGWATAWSFDRLRLWLEKGLDPALAMRQSIIYGISRLAIAFVWIYHGLLPKLLYFDPNETAMLLDAGIPKESLQTSLHLIGVGEIAFGLLLILAWRVRFLLTGSAVLMAVALVVVGIQSPQYLVSAFNPVTLNLSMIGLSIIGLLAGQDLPTAGRCKRGKPKTNL